MKHLTQFIAEKQNFLVNNKLNKYYSSKTKILYTPKTKLELTEIIKKLINSGEKSYLFIKKTDYLGKICQR